MKGNKKKKIMLIIIVVFIVILSTILLFGLLANSWGFKGYYFYTVNNGLDQSTTISTYNSSKSNKASKKKECEVAGYYIDKNRISINIGNMVCGHSIELMKLKVDKNMNVYIKVKEKNLFWGSQNVCNPNMNLYFYRKVNSVILVKEDGNKLGEC